MNFSHLSLSEEATFNPSVQRQKEKDQAPLPLTDGQLTDLWKRHFTPAHGDVVCVHTLPWAVSTVCACYRPHWCEACDTTGREGSRTQRGRLCCSLRVVLPGESHFLRNPGEGAGEEEAGLFTSLHVQGPHAGHRARGSLRTWVTVYVDHTRGSSCTWITHVGHHARGSSCLNPKRPVKHVMIPQVIIHCISLSPFYKTKMRFIFPRSARARLTHIHVHMWPVCSDQPLGHTLPSATRSTRQRVLRRGFPCEGPLSPRHGLSVTPRSTRLAAWRPCAGLAPALSGASWRAEQWPHDACAHSQDRVGHVARKGRPCEVLGLDPRTESLLMGPRLSSPARRLSAGSARRGEKSDSRVCEVVGTIASLRWRGPERPRELRGPLATPVRTRGLSPDVERKRVLPAL